MEYGPREGDSTAFSIVDIMQNRRGGGIFKLHTDRMIKKTVRLLCGDMDHARRKRLYATL
jgi:hypothetical protein